MDMKGSLTLVLITMGMMLSAQTRSIILDADTVNA